MGASPSVVEQQERQEQERQFELLLKSGRNVTDAYKSVSKRRKPTGPPLTSKRKKEEEKSHRSIHVLAIQQLSNNLKNYKSNDLELQSAREIQNSSRQQLSNRIAVVVNREERSNLSITSDKSSRSINVNTITSNNNSPFKSHGNDNNNNNNEDGLSARIIPPRLAKKPTLFVNIHDTYSTSTDQAPQTSLMDSSAWDEYQTPRGTFHTGNIKIGEDGLSNKNIDERKKASVSTGSSQFLEIGPLGSGASGAVMEALHVPSLTIVALKMLPVYNQEKRLQVSREIQVLYKNLVSLQLVDQRLRIDDVDVMSSSSPEDDVTNNNTINNSNPITVNCPNVLSFYNAYLDPRSGLMNLVIEYMDGGSLQDLVNQGGTQDEDILADIAYQSLCGLKFLHDNNHMHRKFDS